MIDEPRARGDRNRNRASRAAIAMVTGAACAIIAIVHAPGISYAVAGILGGLSYALIGVFSRRRRE